jgi:predicted aminopeptidase
MFRLRHLLWLVVGLLLAGALIACSDLDYYLHTAGGHLQVMAERKPIPDLLTDQATPADLRKKLKEIAWIRHFASDRLNLPDNGSYQSYVELDRPYVLWNVVATPEFSLDALEWCFPFAGCVQYRGYFNLEKAGQFAAALQDEGYDTIVSGVPAYSTLSWFDDPALSTFSNWPTTSIARLLFHELAHQKLYVQDDSAFNESFATAVELAGVELWLERFGSEKDKMEHKRQLKREDQFVKLIAGTRDKLSTLYSGTLSVAEKREAKSEVFAELRRSYDRVKMSWDGYSGYDRWFRELNNAKFASLNTYHRWVPAFKRVMAQENNSFTAFFSRCQQIAQLPQARRSELLERLGHEQKNEVSASQTAARKRNS